MKKEIIALLFFMNVLTCSAVAANPCDAPAQAKESFKNEYPGALYSKWETLDDGHIYDVRFVWNNQSLVAYYNEVGEAIGFAKIISIDNLSAKVKKTITDSYPVSEILDVQQLTIYGKPSFYFDIASSGGRFFIRVSGMGEINPVNK
jgi:hypothetical protein